MIFRTNGDPVSRSVLKRIKRSQVIIPLNFTVVNTIEFLIKFVFAVEFKSFVENCTNIGIQIIQLKIICNQPRKDLF